MQYDFVQVRTPFCSQEPVEPHLRVWLAKVGGNSRGGKEKSLLRKSKEGRAKVIV